MTSAFTVRTNSRYDRLAKTLQRRHPEFIAHHRSTLHILATDPYNRSRLHHIKKLEGVPHGDGQYRLSLGRWRFRYDIVGQVVLLSYCGLRREDTY
ncbi:conserved hypothetical protein [Candidatus Sulfopaludibacter sp. SbA4]|nr:conserved hypothetical protein [Candidatus Sulfopaludibacter sp. SbA4]